MQLVTLDWVIVVLSIAVAFLPAVLLARRAGSSTAEFFTSGRAAPWWLIGVSMVATTFSTDTPNLVTNLVREHGVANNWAWWAFLLTGMATVFFYARLWRRSGVLTDLEFYEIRYAGRPAQVVRAFRAVYLGLFFNCVIMASVNLAAAKIANVMLGWPMWQTLLICAGLNIAFAATAGLWGVLVTDMIQFGIAMAGSFAAAYFALQQPEVGGLHGLMTRLDPGVLRLLPDFGDWKLTVSVLVIPITVQWWSVWYPGAEPGGGSYIAQRMLAARTERDAMAGTLFFNVAHYALRSWPWIIVALASLLVYPQLSDIAVSFPHVDPKLIGHDMAYPAMLKFLPRRLAGAHGGGAARGVRLDPLDAPQLGHLLPGARPLPPLPAHRRDGAPLRDGGADRHRAADAGGGRTHLRPRFGPRELPAAALDRRRHRAALPAPVVLVADQRLERDQRDDLLLPAGGGLPRGAEVRHPGRPDRPAPPERRHHHAWSGSPSRSSPPPRSEAPC